MSKNKIEVIHKNFYNFHKEYKFFSDEQKKKLTEVSPNSEKIKTEPKIKNYHNKDSNKKTDLKRLGINKFTELIGSRVLYQGYVEATVTGWSDINYHFTLIRNNNNNLFMSIPSRLHKLPEKK